MDFTGMVGVLWEWLRVGFNFIGISGIICVILGFILFWVFKKMKWKALIIALILLILIVVLVWKFNIDLPSPSILANLSSEIPSNLSFNLSS